MEEINPLIKVWAETDSKLVLVDNMDLVDNKIAGEYR